MVIVRILAYIVVLVALVWLPPSVANPLATTSIPVLGLQINLDTRPDLPGLQNTMTAVKNIPTGVHTFVGMPGVLSLPTLAPGSLVKAEMTGPALGNETVTLAAVPNQLLEIPPLGAAGDYRLFNVRLEGPDGNVILRRNPALDSIVINVIDELLVSQVTSRPLTLEEIQEKGIVIDEDNFTAFNFAIGLTLGSEQVVIDLPVAIPNTTQAAINLDPPSFATLPAVRSQFAKITIPNFSLSGFGLRPPPELEEKGISLPAINGVIIIPGNIAFLNQFFSVILQTTNLGPVGSGLDVLNARAMITLPLGEDEIKGSGDDPLRIAETQIAGIQEELPLLNVDGVDTILPQGSNQAEFLVEGLREGTHVVNFDIIGDLFVPSLGETFELTGKAAGVVQVRNPTFNLVLAHPDVVREGEEYSLFATVTNTSSSPANLFKLQLNSRSLSGARLAEGETDARTLDFLAPGQAESFEFRLVARTTGQVTGTVFLADEGINGSFILTTGVGDTGIPLSPDTLILPQTVDYLPDEPDLVFAAVRMLGQAYSVATAPAGALPLEIARISRSHVFDRAVKVAQAGLHIRFGESDVMATQDILMDWFGNDLMRLDELFPDDSSAVSQAEKDMRAFDGLRRAADAGNDLSDVLGELIGQGLATQTLSALQRQWAETFATRPPHMSFGVSSQGPPLSLNMIDIDGNKLGRLAADEPLQRDIAFADRLALSNTDQVLFVAVPESASYRFEFTSADEGSVNLSLVLPNGTGMEQVLYSPIDLPGGAFARMTWSAAGPNDYQFEFDTDGDGVTDRTLLPDSVTPVADAPPGVIGVHQWGKGAQPGVNPSFEAGDPIGRMVGILFNEEVTTESAENLIAYNLPRNTTTAVSLQPDRRLAFVVMEVPFGPFVERELAVNGVTDMRGQMMAPQDFAIIADPDRGVGGTFSGRVVSVTGEPIPFANVDYLQPLSFSNPDGACFDNLDVHDFIITSFQTDSLGRFNIDYVLQSGFPPPCPGNPDVWLNENNAGGTINFKLEATDPETGEVGKASSRIQFDGQRMNFDVIIRGFGAIEGSVFDKSGNPIVGGEPSTLRVIARNVSTGEAYESWVDESGYYAFPRSFEGADGARFDAPNIAVGNIILQIIRPADGFTAVSTVNIPAAGVRVTQDLVMISPSRYGTVQGRVLNADGETGAANVSVQIAGQVLSSISLFNQTFTQGIVGSTITDDQGFFQFENIPAGDIELKAIRQATFEQIGAESFLFESEVRELVLVFPGSGGTVRGIVRDALGNPVPFATVAGGPTLTQADENGFFEISGLPLGSLTVYGQGADSLALGLIKVDSLGPNDVQDVVVTLPGVGSITGSVFEADGVTPIAAQQVQLWVGNQGVMAETYTAGDGTYRFSKFPLGDYTLKAVRADYGDGGQAFTSIRFAGDERDADIFFRGLGGIKGRVIQSNGTPVISDVIITRKVWRIIPDAAASIPNVYVDFIKELAEVSDDLSDTVDRVLAENNLDQPPPTFFFLTDEPVLISSDILGPNGEVTGRFDFTESVTGGSFSVAAFGPFLSPAVVDGVIPVTTVATERIVDVGDIVLEPATGSVKGTVYLPDGVTPVGENVKVKLRSLDDSGDVKIPGGVVSQPVLPEIDVLTDANGQFSFPLVLKGGFILNVDTGAPDPLIRADTAAEMQTERFVDDLGERVLNVRLFAQAAGVTPRGETVTIDIQLLDVAGVEVQVMANDGITPVPFAEVSLATQSGLDAVFEFGFSRQITDENGFIDFFPVIEGGFSVNARDPGPPARGVVSGAIPVDPLNGHIKSVTVTLGAVTTSSGQVVQALIFGAVEGAVFKADGAPMVNPSQVKVRASGVDILTTSDATGRYRAENVPGGFFSVEAFEPFTARRGSATGSITFQDQIADIPVTLVGLGTVTGEVLSNNGNQMLTGVDVILFPSGNFTDKLISRTNAQGVYSLPGVPLGTYMVKANDNTSGLTGEADGFMRNDGDSNTTNVFLEAAGQITGILYATGVELDADGNPIEANPPVVAGASIEIRKGNRHFTQVVQTGSDGRFTSGPFLTAGTYALKAVPVGGNDGGTASTAIEYDAQVADVALVLRGQGTVEGVVLDSLGGNPVETARVTLSSNSPFSSGAVTRFTDANGAFLFENVAVGNVSLSVQTTLQSPQLGGAASGVLNTQGQNLIFRDGDGDTAHNAIRLQPAGEIKAQVIISDGVTFAEGAIIEIKLGGINLSRIADANGMFSFAGIPLGAYALSVREPVSNGVAQFSVALATNGEVVDLGVITLDDTSPQVVDTLPARSSVDVIPNVPLLVTFNELIDPASVNADTFQVSVDGQLIAGSFSTSPIYPEIAFTPDASLPDLRQVSVVLKGNRLGFEGQVIESGIQDLAGLGLNNDFRYSFITGDTQPPVVVSLSPPSDAAEVALESVIRFEFSEPLDRTFIAGFTLTQGGVLVAGSMNALAILGDRVFVFTPDSPLLPNRSYTATLQGPLMDVFDNAMADNAVSSTFQTIDTLAPVIQALSVVSGSTLISGATVPVAADMGTAADIAFVEFYVDGQVAFSDSSAPYLAPVFLDPAFPNSVTVGAVAVDTTGNRSPLRTLQVPISDNQPPMLSIISPASGNISIGQVVVINVDASDDIGLAEISFTANGGTVASGVKVIAAQLNAQGNFSFTVPGTLPVGSLINIQAAARDMQNIVSQSSAVLLTVQDLLPPLVTIGSPANGSRFNPGAQVDVFVRGDDSSGITRLGLDTTGALISSQARDILPAISPVAQTFSIQIPADAQPTDVITLIARATDAAGNSATRNIALRINDYVVPQITLSSMTGSLNVEPGGQASIQVTASDEVGVTRLTIAADGITAQNRAIAAASNVMEVFNFTIPADAPLGSSIIVNATAQDGASNITNAVPLILAVRDLSAPAVTITTPANGVEVNPGASLSITVTANDSFGVSSIDFTASGAASVSEQVLIDPALSSSEQVFTVLVPADAVAGTVIVVQASATDSAGNTSPTAQISVNIADVVAPQVILMTPADGAVEVDPDVAQRVDFNELIAAATAASLVLSGPEGQVPAMASLVNGGAGIRLVPNAPLALGATYTLTATTGITDVSGNALATAASVSFTIKQPDTTAPVVTAVAPNDGAVGVPVTTQVAASFSEVVAQASIDVLSVILTPDGGAPLAARVILSADGQSVSLIPDAELAINTLYRVAITTAVTDLAGNSLAAAFASSFTTETGDITGPELLSLTPANGANDVSVQPIIRAVFDEALDPATVDALDPVLKDATGATIAATLTLVDGGTTLELRPDNTLTFSTSYTVELSGVLADLAGNAATDASGVVFTSLIYTFSTGSFAITSPVDGANVVEGSEITLAVGTGSALADVIFEINGQPLAPVTAPYTTRYTVPPAAQAAVLTIAAQGRDDSGMVIVENTVVVNVVPGLIVEPTMLGVPLGDSADMKLTLSSSLAVDLPVNVSIINGEVASVAASIVIPAGQTELLLPVTGLAAGSSTVIVNSAQGDGATIVSVSPLISGETITIANPTLFISINASPFAGKLILPVGELRTIGVKLLNEPVATATTVITTSSDASVIALTAPVVIPAGSTVANVSLSGQADGQANILFRLGNERVDMQVIVGLPPAGFVSGIVTQPLGLSVQPHSFIGQLELPESVSRTVTLKLLDSPAEALINVLVSSGDPAIADVIAPVVIEAGSQVARIEFTTGIPGSTELALTAGSLTLTLPVSVSTPSGAVGLTSRTVGLSVQPHSFIGQLELPESVSRTVTLKLLDSPAEALINVLVSSGDPAIADVIAPVVIEAGSQVARIELTTGIPGSTELALTAGSLTLTLPVSVSAPSGAVGLTSSTVGISVRPVGTAGTLIMDPMDMVTVQLPLLSAPAMANVTVNAVSRDAAVADVNVTPVTINIGDTVATLAVIAGALGGSETLIELSFNGEKRTLHVIVGLPEAGEEPLTIAPVVGVEVP